ncbi:uncharacterized protein LOC111340036 isoform X2 [Stylophora pistillata]|uniref:uncharacterized protein LOC111340036 isoform X2 n=1 Tax=Stylophora pistillata TaxID=50429 RepID=UPI000C03B21C|nr:uncharacterized protein LOC111340036 isoform X2 [Stylophora pistillata]
MSFELASNGTSPPSSMLKKEILLLLESCKDCMDILGKELRIDTTQCKAVCEVVATSEERDGQELSLDKWMSIFQSLGCPEEFEKLLEEDVLLDVNTLDNCPPDSSSNHTQETLLKESEELRQQKIKPVDGHSRLSESELKSNLPSKPGDNVEETWKTSTALGNSPELGLPPPLEDETSMELVKDTTTVLKDDDEEHQYPEVGKGSESMVLSVGQKENSQTNASSLLEEESHSTSQINDDGNLNSGDLRSRSQPVTSNATNSPLPIVTGHQYRPNSPKAGEVIAVNQDGQNLQEHGRVLCAAFSLPLANESSLTANHLFHEGTPSHISGMDEETDSRSWSQIETVSIPNLDGLSTGSRPVSPDAANYQILPVESHQLHPSKQMNCHANAVDHDWQTLGGGMPLDAQPSSASSLPALHAKPVVQDPVGQFHQTTEIDSYGADEAEDSSSSSQSDTDGSLSAGDSKAQSRLTTISPQLHLLPPNNLMSGKAAVMTVGPAMLENKGMPLDAQLSPAISASSLPALHARPVVQDPVGQFHQTTATDTYGAGEAEDSSSSSQSDADGSLSWNDSGTQSRPVTPQAAISPQLRLLPLNNPMPGKANSAVSPDRPVLNRGMPLDAQLSPTIDASSLPALHARPAVQNPVCQVHQGMAHATHSTDEGESSGSPSENDDATQDVNILQQVQAPFQLGEIAFLTRNLWKMTEKYEACMEDLQACEQDLQHSRQQCAQLQGTSDELQRYLDYSNYLQQENQRLIGMTQEMCECKDQAIQQLRQENESLRGEQLQMLRQMAQRHNSYQQQELRQTVAEVRQLRECVLEAGYERLRLENERLSNQRMTELSEAFLKQELDEEKHKRAEAEETNRCLSEEIFQLQTMVNELMSRPAKLVEVPCTAPSPDTVQENLVSSSTDLTVRVEEADEESDGDEEVYEDALDHL